MEHIINAIAELEIKLIQAKDIDAAALHLIQNKLAEMKHDAKYIERVIRDFRIEGII